MSVTDFTSHRVKHPDWVLRHGQSFCRSMKLYSINRTPQVLDVFLLVTPIAGVLRGIYGGIFRALWFMFCHYAKERMNWAVTVGIPAWWHFTILRRNQQQWEAKFPDELEEEPHA